jgi:hypothetical protein
MSAAEVRDHIDSRWYELVLACDEDEQLAEGEGAGAGRRSSAAMTLATPAQGREVLPVRNE